MQGVPIATARGPLVPPACHNAPRATARAPWHRVRATVVYMAMAPVRAKEFTRVGTKDARIARPMCMGPIATSNAIAQGLSTRLASVRASMAREVVVVHHRSIMRWTALATIVNRGILVAIVKNARATVAAPPTTNNATMVTMARAVAFAGQDGVGPIANRAPTTMGAKYPFGWSRLWRWRW